MSSIGTGYDLDCAIYSPDGRVFQVEYACKAANNSGTVVGIACRDGAVLAVEKILHSRLVRSSSSRRTHILDDHICGATAGLVTDAQALVDRAREEADNWRDVFSEEIRVDHLARNVAEFAHVFTMYSGYRPFGCSMVLAGSEENPATGARTGKVFVVSPDGSCKGYHAAAIGKAHQAACTELEKILPQRDQLTARQALVEAAKVLLSVHDDTRDKIYEVEMMWVSEETGWKAQRVSDEDRDAAIAEAVATRE